MAFDHRSGEHLQIDTAQLYYEVLGNREDPAVVLLHGGIGNIEDFNGLVERLHKRLCVVGIDTRGHGRSTLGTLGLTYARMQQDVERVLAHLHLSNPIVIGFSDGGITALRLAAAGKPAIRKLVIIGTPATLERPNRELYAKINGEIWRKQFPEMYARYLALNPAPDFDALIKTAVTAWLDETDSGYPQRSVERIACDVLVARGDDDPLVSRESTFALSQALRSAKWLNLPFAGHELHKDQAELLMSTLNRFLSE
jgi:valacyclovir hydrolase